MELLLTLMVVIFAVLCILFALLLVILCHLYKRRSSRKMMGWGREHCCHQPDCAPGKAPVFTLATSCREGNYHQEEPVYQEPSWAPKSTIVYGVITAKERAKYIPPIS